MEINDRIKEIIDYYGLSVNQFEQKICTTRGKIYKGLERNSDFGSTTIAKILDHCDNISPDWLLLGKGEMLRKDTPPSSEIINKLFAELGEAKEKIGELKYKLQQEREKTKLPSAPMAEDPILQ